MGETPFLTDIKVLRDRARQHMELGAGIPGYNAGPAIVVKLLNEVLATELAFELKYEGKEFMAPGLDARDNGVIDPAGEFVECTDAEQTHVDQIAERIVQLGGVPEFFPEVLQKRTHSEYVRCDSLTDMLKENLMAERIANDSYIELITFLDKIDPTTRRILKKIAAVEEEHANDLVEMMETMENLTAKASARSSVAETFRSDIRYQNHIQMFENRPMVNVPYLLHYR